VDCVVRRCDDEWVGDGAEFGRGVVVGTKAGISGQANKHAGRCREREGEAERGVERSVVCSRQTSKQVTLQPHLGPLPVSSLTPAHAIRCVSSDSHSPPASHSPPNRCLAMPLGCHGCFCFCMCRYMCMCACMCNACFGLHVSPRPDTEYLDTWSVSPRREETRGP
jgi:hypothetical protein